MSHVLIFDSGIGGLSVVADIRRRLPDLSLDYIADDAFRPYGNKSADQLNERLPYILHRAVERFKSDAIVIACNTASTTSLPAIREKLSVPIIGVVPAIKPAARDTLTGHIGVLGTPGTVSRKYVGKLITDFAQGVKVTLKGSVALVEMAEHKLTGTPVHMGGLQQELASFIDQAPPIDRIVLACTHFPLLKDEMNEIMGHELVWVDSGEAIARRLESVLIENKASLKTQNPRNQAFTTGTEIGPARQAVFHNYGFENLQIFT